jgi:hypothetical protein
VSDLNALKNRRDEPILPAWPGEVPAGRHDEAVALVRLLLDDLIALGPDPTEAATRAAVDACVRRFNNIDDGWITTIEREDVTDTLSDIVALTGFEPDDAWFDERDW